MIIDSYLEEVSHGLINLFLPVIREWDEVVLSVLGELTQDLFARFFLNQLEIKLFPLLLSLILDIVIVLRV